MATVSISDTSQYLNLSALSGVGGSLVVTNESSSPVYLLSSPTQPASDEYGVLCWNSEEVYVRNTAGNSVWVKAQRTGSMLVQAVVGASAQYSLAALPEALMTTGPEGYQRIRVDVAQTGFFLGTEFRSFYEFSIGSGNSVYLKFTSPINFILHSQTLSVDSGGIRFSALTGSTVGGSWTNLPVIGKNRMTTRPTPYYTAQAQPSQGGSSTGGTIVEVFRVVAAGATAQQTTVGGIMSDERGLPAGEYILRLECLGNSTATGVYAIYWEERP